MHLLQAKNPSIKDELVAAINCDMNVEKETNRMDQPVTTHTCNLSNSLNLV